MQHLWRDHSNLRFNHPQISSPPLTKPHYIAVFFSAEILRQKSESPLEALNGPLLPTNRFPHWIHHSVAIL